MTRTSRRRGQGLVEVLVAITLMACFSLPILGLSASSTRSTFRDRERLTLGARARARVLDVLEQSDDELAALVGQDVPMPADLAALEGVEEEVRVEEVEEGLFRVRARVAWADPRGNPRELTVTRLRSRRTLSLQARTHVGGVS